MRIALARLAAVLGLISVRRRRSASATIAVFVAFTAGFALASGASTVAQPSWIQLILSGPSPSVRSNAVMAYDPATSLLVLFGGAGSYGSLDDTWTWDGTNWTQLPVTGPSIRRDAAMAYDPVTSQLILFGGHDVPGPPLGDTWTWNGTSWSQLFPAHFPSPRSASTLAFDPVTSQLILFGGDGDTSILGDTWAWNGGDWTLLSPAKSPPPRFSSVMAYDPATSQLILFGGYGGPYLADTWVWTGSTWSQQFPANSPPYRLSAVMAYNPATSQLILFGGGPNAYRDTWVWTGSTWSQLTPATSPTGRYGAVMAYYPVNSQFILFGGYNNGFLGDTWTYKLAPTITSANGAAFGVGTAGTFTVTTTGAPPPSLTENGALPTGVTFVDNHDGTATLSGTPQAGTASVYPLTIVASNGIPPDASESFTLTVGSRIYLPFVPR